MMSARLFLMSVYMSRLLLSALCLMSVTMSACAEKQDEQYFMSHPDALQSALASCPGHSPEAISCAALHSLATDMQSAVMTLQQNPQELGMKIIALQNKLATSQSTSSERDEQLLSRYMAVVRLFESPGR